MDIEIDYECFIIEQDSEIEPRTSTIKLPLRVKIIPTPPRRLEDIDFFFPFKLSWKVHHIIVLVTCLLSHVLIKIDNLFIVTFSFICWMSKNQPHWTVYENITQMIYRIISFHSVDGNWLEYLIFQLTIIVSSSEWNYTMSSKLDQNYKVKISSIPLRLYNFSLA